jgi:hypothetical protein
VTHIKDDPANTESPADVMAAHLDQLGNRISADDREKIEAAIVGEVQHPTPRQCEIAERYDAEMVAWFRSPVGTPRPAWPDAQ